MRLVAYLQVFLGISLSVAVLGRHTDNRWLQQPAEKIKVFCDQTITLQWTYQLPAKPDHSGRVTFARRLLGDLYETALLGGSIDSTGHISVNYATMPDRLSIAHTKQTITVYMHNATLTDRGSYSIEVMYSSDPTLYDAIDVQIFEYPVFKNLPEEEIYADLTYTAEVRYVIEAMDKHPDIRLVTFTHNGSDVRTSELVHAQKLYDSDSWSVSDTGDESFSGRVAYLHAVRENVMYIDIVLSNLMATDTGQYVLNVYYEDDIATLTHSLSLHVLRGITWYTSPSNPVYAVESRDVKLTYTLDSTNRDFSLKTFKFFKDDHERELVSLFAKWGQHTVYNASHGDGRLKVKYRGVSRTPSLYINIINVTANDSAIYTLKLYDAALLVAINRVTFRVFREDEIVPVITVNNTTLPHGDIISCSPGHHIIALPDGVPRPDLAMYLTDGQSRTLFTRVKDMDRAEILLTGSIINGRKVELLFDYHFYNTTVFLEYTSGSVVTCLGLRGSGCIAVAVLLVVALLLLVALIVCAAICRKRQTNAGADKEKYRVQSSETQTYNSGQMRQTATPYSTLPRSLYRQWPTPAESYRSGRHYRRSSTPYTVSITLSDLDHDRSRELIHSSEVDSFSARSSINSCGSSDHGDRQGRSVNSDSTLRNDRASTNSCGSGNHGDRQRSAKSDSTLRNDRASQRSTSSSSNTSKARSVLEITTVKTSVRPNRDSPEYHRMGTLDRSTSENGNISPTSHKTDTYNDRKLRNGDVFYANGQNIDWGRQSLPSRISNVGKLENGETLRNSDIFNQINSYCSRSDDEDSPLVQPQRYDPNECKYTLLKRKAAGDVDQTTANG